ncbi:MAG: hypothetical protein ACOX32_01225 [Bacteroidaceae bacterium]|jgi:hypothetical protein
MRFLVLTLLSLFTLTGFSQDLIILRNGEQIDCKITKVDTDIIHYDVYIGEIKISSYVNKNDIRNYTISMIDNVTEESDAIYQMPDNSDITDTNINEEADKHLEYTDKWINLITYSQNYGMNADSWSLQYYRFFLRDISRWSFPVTFAIERFTIHPDYFAQFNYRSASMSYYSIGINPFYRLKDNLILKDNLFINIGANIIIGEEKLTTFSGVESYNIFFGLAPSQGIYFIPKSKIGITLGLGVYEKLLNSKVYNNDIGVKLEIGIKF